MPWAIDIETIPNKEMAERLPEIPLQPINPRLKDKAKIEEAKANAVKKQEEAKVEQIDKMALSPYTGRICAFACVGDVDGAEAIKKIDDQSEKFLLEKIFDIIDNQYPLSGNAVITFNGYSFDFPFIYMRAMLLGLDTPAYPLSNFMKRYTYSPHFDVRMALTSWDMRAHGSLAYFGKMILNQEKPEMGYDKYIGMIESGKSIEIAEECLEHTKMTYCIYEKIKPYIVGGSGFSPAGRGNY